MDSGLQLARTQIITPEDYEAHMAAIGQAQAAAALTREIIQSAGPPDGGRIAIVGAGTGQMLDFLDPSLFRPFRITCTDLNPSFLARLKERLAEHGLSALVFEDNIEHTTVEPAPGPPSRHACAGAYRLASRSRGLRRASPRSLWNHYSTESTRHDFRSDAKPLHSAYHRKGG